MNVENNQLNIKYIKQNVSTTTKSDTRLHDFLAKFNINAAENKEKHNNNYASEPNKSHRKMFWKKETKDPSDETPELVYRPNIGEILQEFSTNSYNNEDMRETYGYDKDFNEEELDYYDYNIAYAQNRSPPKKSYTCCSKNIRNLSIYIAQSQNKMKFVNNNSNENDPSSSNNYDNNNSDPIVKSYAEKTTYCRPLNNLNSQEFIYKTVERNAKLQQLLKKLVVVRRREKEREEWNNYVNELKNKHGYYSNQPRHIAPQYVPQERNYYESLDDYYGTAQSQPYRSLLHDLYGYTNAPNYKPPEYNIPTNGYYDTREYKRVCENPGFGNVYENEPSCYPTSSKGRLMMLRRERDLGDPWYKNIPVHRNLNNPRVIVVEKDFNAYRKRRKTVSVDVQVCPCYQPSILQNNAVQTEDIATCSSKIETKDTKIPHVSFNVLSAIEDETKREAKSMTKSETKQDKIDNTKDESKIKTEPGEKTTKEKYDEVTVKVNTLKEIVESNELKMQQKSSLMNIESKLDAFLKSLKCFKSNQLCESTSTSTLMDSSVVMRQSSLCSDAKAVDTVLRSLGADAFGKKMTIVGNATTNTSMSVLQSRPNTLGQLSSTTRIENILCEELDKSNKLRKEMEELLYTQVNQPCAVQISFDIPTKERATEVTASLSKTKLSDANRGITIEEIKSDREDERQMTIAVNTDPMGLLALFRVSSEAIKQLMSYVPNVDYGWYLSRIPLPQLSGGRMTDYVCNICGAVFAQSYQLSNHIQTHNLGDTKDCCVCRHVLEVKRHPIGHFTCQYCGQRFTRAYCCELHQQSCARALGRQHDVTSSLMLLR